MTGTRHAFAGAGRRLLSGVDVLAELPLLMRARDAARGLTTGGFVSGYRGSPLAQFDRSVQARAAAYGAAGVVFRPGLNEDLAATAVWGTQQTGLFDGVRVDGVFGLWYGKGPGVDRSLDVLRHANAAGTDPRGGVLALMGDDHGAVSSTLPHQSDHDMIAAMIPILAPAGVAEFPLFGLMGWDLSRASGAWVGLKCPTEIVESSGSVLLDTGPPVVAVPGAGTLGLRAGDGPAAQEARLFDKLRLAQAFARANGLDRESGASGQAVLGIVAGGKGHADTMEALAMLGLDAAAAARAGIALRKPGLVWPLDPEGLRAFAARCAALLVVEEKRPLIEDQVRAILYDGPARPPVMGRTGAGQVPLLPSAGEIGPLAVARAILACLPDAVAQGLRPLPGLPPAVASPPGLKRESYFCAGCPHAVSTRLPQGSRATTGIGCHMMMIDAPGRATSTFTQMGGEGMPWIGLSPFTDEGHIFVNMGDGTYFHSGVLAIRAAIAAGVNATYKVLFNDAVAMTGGQRHDGPLDVPRLAAQLLAEGAARVAVVAETPERLRGRLPAGVSLDPRDRLDAVQRTLRDVPGVTVLVYDQVCAAEKRRRRKASEMPAPPVRAMINEAVCEGCGDCAVQSGCIALEPVETPLGPKRRIDAAACNVDLSCLKGFCPSFVTVSGSAPAAPRRGAAVSADDLPDPVLPALPAGEPFNLVLAGIGGTGVLTVSRILARAAHHAGLQVGALDQTGLSQKNGAVVSHLRFGSGPVHAARIAPGAADLVLAFDMVVAAGPKVAPLVAPGRTRLVMDDRLAPTAQIAREGLPPPDAAAMARVLGGRVAAGDAMTVAAADLARATFADTMPANLVLLGHAWQRGLIPLPLAALAAALGSDANRAAFALGRRAASGQGVRPDTAAATAEETLEALVARGAAHLQGWGGAPAAARFRAVVAVAQAAEARQGLGEAFTRAVAQTALRLMPYKDEYEVARLHRDPVFRAAVAASHGPSARLTWHLAPPFLPLGRDGRTGRPRKVALGRAADWAFALLVRLRPLRGTPFDPFGHTAERRAERRLVAAFEALVARLATGLSADTHASAVEAVQLGLMVRGYGPVKASAIARYQTALAERGLAADGSA
ncbi:MAG: indolepyruvate ferredoxin oxidoreductase family protein [Rhodobacteraceae bacterium]|jgi:indolepyruvate ferredoxin oxidoreductase|nr:indolepyruvate ferredoxin oxidoreductase family protein [Paracoccaceae bacterium]